MKRSLILLALLIPAFAYSPKVEAGCHSGGAVAGGVIGGFAAGALLTSLWNKRKCRDERYCDCRYCDHCNRNYDDYYYRYR